MRVFAIVLFYLLISFNNASYGSVNSGYDKPIEAEVDFNQFISKLINKKVQNIPEAIEMLPEAYKKNFTLMHNSQSLQSSSPFFPRAILYGNTATSIFTFNGNPEDSGFGSIENVTTENDTLNFREITFKKITQDKTSSTLARGEIAFENEDLIVSKANPSKCMVCHGFDVSGKSLKSPRYIWNQFNSWPNAYGSIEDNLSAFGLQKVKSEGKILSELKAFKIFKMRALNKKNPHPRYSKLIFADSDYSPYLDNSGEKSILNMPNYRLGILLAVNYTYNMARKFIRTYFSAKKQPLQETLLDEICSIYKKREYPKTNYIISDIYNKIGFTQSLNPISETSSFQNTDLWISGINNYFMNLGQSTYLQNHLGAHIINYFLREPQKRDSMDYGVSVQYSLFSDLNTSTREHFKNYSLSVYSKPQDINIFKDEIKNLDCVNIN